MSHECEDCGGTFDTLTEKRTHDCSGEETSASGPGEETSASGSVEGDYDSDLDALRDRIEADDFDALYGALATLRIVNI